MHVDEGRLQRLLDGELAPAEEASVRAHAAACEECARLLAASAAEEERVHRLLLELDSPAPRLDVAAIPRRTVSRGIRIPRWAAAVALVVGLAGAAYALPGSPLPRLVDAIAEWARGRPGRPPIDSASPAAPAPSVAGIAVPPGNDLVIFFGSSNSRGHVFVRLTGSTEVEIRAPRDAAAFTSEAHRIVIDDQGLETTYEIGIPSTAPRVEIRVGRNRIFLKEGARITTLAPPGSTAPYHLSLKPSSR